ELTAQGAQLDAAARLLDDARELRTVSADGATALGAVLFEDSMFDLDPAVKAEVAGILEDATIAGVDIDCASAIATSLGGLIGPGEITGLLIAGIVLVVMLGSLLPASLPLFSSLAGVGVGVGGSLAFSGVVDMSSVTPVLGVMLGLAVGIDYALFI